MVETRKALGFLALVTLAGLIPFLDKAFCMDDPLFLWAAEQIQAHPLDFYGSRVNWFGTDTPLYEATKNPPLTPFYLAAAAWLVGWDEPPSHAAMLLPAIGAIFGTWFLARSFCRQPVSAALVVLVTPAFLVSSTNLMCDTTLLCFWTWAVALWVKGLNSNRGLWLAFAALLIAAAALTKYFGLCLLPLLVVYTIVRDRGPTWKLAWLLWAVAPLAAFEWWTGQRYGRGLISDAAVYSVGTHVWWLEAAIFRAVIGLSFIGGSLLPVVFCAPWLLTKRGLAAIAGLAAVVTLLAKEVLSRQQLAALHMTRDFTWLLAGQLGLMTAGGVLVLWMAVRPLVKDRSADACLLSLWVVGTFAFAGFVNWACNVRSVLPMAPAVAILLVQRLEDEKVRRWRGLFSWRWALAPAAVVALLVARADVSLADSARTAAMQFGETLRPKGHMLWFIGHWGFQYYMRASGAREVDLSNIACDPGDVVVTPYNNTNTYPLPREALGATADVEFPVCAWLSTLNPAVGADFYAADVGPMPFAFGPVPPEKYAINRIERRLRSQH